MAKHKNKIKISKKKIMKVSKIILMIFGIFFLILVGLVILGISLPTTCTTNECFIDEANACGKVEMYSEMPGGGWFRFYSKNCEFKKTVSNLYESETQEMKDLLEGKSLICKFESGEFDENWINSPLEGLEKCKGKLKDIIAQLILFS